MAVVLEKSFCRSAARLVADGIHWQSTPEGHDFWAHLQNRLVEYGQGLIPPYSLIDIVLKNSGQTALPLSAKVDQRIAELENSVKSRDKEIERLHRLLEQSATHITEQNDRIARLQKRLLAADLFNSRHVRGL